MIQSGSQVVVGYVLRRFPVLSETFVLNEMLGLEKRGVKLHIFSMERPNDPRFHEVLPKLQANIRYIHDITEYKMLLQRNVEASKLYRKNYYKTLFYVLTRFRPSLLWRFLQSGYIAAESNKAGIQIFHGHFANRPATVALFTSMITGIPFSFTAHAADIYRSRVAPKVLTEKIQKARFVVAESGYNKDFMENISGEKSGKIVRIYNGVDLSVFTPNGRVERSPFTIISVARLVEKKGLKILVEACKKLRDQNLDFQCLIIGKGPLRAELAQTIKSYQLKKHVHLLGPKTNLEVLEHVRKSDLFVLPCIVGSDGNRDGLPASIIEALACGLPVITTAMVGIPEIIKNGHNGFMVSENDVLALTQTIGQLISNPGLYDELKKNTRPSVQSTHDLNLTSAAIHRLFDPLAQ